MSRTAHLIFLLEEPSLEALLRELLPSLVGSMTYELHQFGGKQRLLERLGDRLSGYSKWLPSDTRIIVVVDRDDDDCLELKDQLNRLTASSGLRGRAAKQTWQVAHRIAVEELEAWFFGDWQAVCEAFPGVPEGIHRKAKFRKPDEIQGGTWEALERILQGAGYFKGGLAKIELARSVGPKLSPTRNTSVSFQSFVKLLTEL
jgi:hypothetical protein